MCEPSASENKDRMADLVTSTAMIIGGSVILPEQI